MSKQPNDPSKYPTCEEKIDHKNETKGKTLVFTPENDKLDWRVLPSQIYKEHGYKNLIMKYSLAPTISPELSEDGRLQIYQEFCEQIVMRHAGEGHSDKNPKISQVGFAPEKYKNKSGFRVY